MEVQIRVLGMNVEGMQGSATIELRELHTARSTPEKLNMCTLNCDTENNKGETTFLLQRLMNTVLD